MIAEFSFIGHTCPAEDVTLVEVTVKEMNEELARYELFFRARDQLATIPSFVTPPHRHPGIQRLGGTRRNSLVRALGRIPEVSMATWRL